MLYVQDTRSIVAIKCWAKHCNPIINKVSRDPVIGLSITNLIPSQPSPIYPASFAFTCPLVFYNASLNKKDVFIIHLTGSIWLLLLLR